MAPGDIVQQLDHPQWGRGYVIHARKASADVFFHWGGRRRVASAEPLEPGRVSGADIALFALCAGVSSRAWSRGHHHVSAVELDRSVWKHRAFRDRNPGGAAGGCLYSA